jgi:hypothetical protein
LKALDGLPEEKIPDERWLNAYCGNVIEAINRMMDWMAS